MQTTTETSHSPRIINFREAMVKCSGLWNELSTLSCLKFGSWLE